MAVIVANTGFVPAVKASFTDKPAVADVMKAHTVPAVVACVALGASGELIVYVAAVLAVAVTEDVPAAMAIAAVGVPRHVDGAVHSTGVENVEYRAQ